MNKTVRLLKQLQPFLVLTLSLTLPIAGWSDITNTASVSYKDAANNSYPGTSNTVVITTPPQVTGGSLTVDVGVAITPYQIVAVNGPTGYSATGLPAGLSVNASGQVTGTPTTPGVYPATITATNAAGPGKATLTITVRSAANIVLTKSASVSTAKAGDTITFTIGYTNNGSGSASNVAVTDAIPTGSTLVPGSITGGGSVSAGTLTWNVNTVAAGASGTVSFQVTAN